ncbi:MAG: hypothetical protein AAGA91_20735 [Pseudomonadota bacterium]
MLVAYADNLFNSEVITSSFANPVVGKVSGTMLSPREVGLLIDIEF